VPPALSYIIPAFNAAATLGETLGSVLTQSCRAIEAIVVDDGSTDGTARIARSCPDRRVSVIQQENRGLAGARNRGLAAAAAPAVCFLDADDSLEPRHAEAMLAALQGHDLAACWYRMVGPRLEDLGWTIRPGDHDFTPARMVEYNPIAVGSVVARVEVLARLGPDGAFDSRLVVHEDWDCWMRLTAAGARWAPVVAEALFDYRLQAGSMSADLLKMHDVGRGVITAAPFDDRLKPGALRRWAIRHIARAAARGERTLVERFLRAASTQGPPELSPDELELLAGSLRWALCQEHRIGPGRTPPELAAAWRSLAAEVLAGTAGLGMVLDRLRFPPDPFDAAAQGLRRLLDERPGSTGVVYGLGRNGRALLDSLAALRAELPLAWIDDDPACSAPIWRGRPLPRLRPELLGPGHIVIVTPERRAGILGALGRRGAAAALTIEALAMDGEPRPISRC
jgi:hypothetical protein